MYQRLDVVPDRPPYGRTHVLTYVRTYLSMFAAMCWYSRARFGSRVDGPSLMLLGSSDTDQAFVLKRPPDNIHLLRTLLMSVTQSVVLGDERVVFKMAFIRGVGADMPCQYLNRPVFKEYSLDDIMDQEQDTFDRLTMTQMHKFARVFERHGTWAHPTTKILLGTANNLVTFKFINAPEPHAAQQVFGYAVFQGPTWNTNSPWFGKQVVIRAFPSTEAPTLCVNVTGDVAYLRSSLILMCQVTVAGSLAGAMVWSKVYEGTTRLYEVMKAYRSHVTRTRNKVGEPMGEVKFLLGHKLVDIHHGRMMLSQLWPPTSAPIFKAKRARDDSSKPSGSPPAASSSQAGKKSRTLSTQTYDTTNIAYHPMNVIHKRKKQLVDVITLMPSSCTLWLYIYIYVHNIRIRIYIHIRTYIYIRTYVRTCLYIRTYIYIYTYVHTYIVYVRIYVRIRICLYICTYIRIYTCVYIHTYIRTYTYM